MNISTMIKSIFIFTSLLLLTACGSNTKPDGADLPASESGQSASISCSVADETTSPIIAHCYVHTVDGNSNPVSGLTYKITLINHVKSSGQTGSILSDTPIRFNDYNQNFSKDGVKISDNLIVFPSKNAYDPSYLGGWKIVAVNNTDLTFSGDNIAYNLETTEDLSYVAGSASGVSLQKVDDSQNSDNTGATVIEPEGLYYFDIAYDPELKGSVIYIGAQTSGNRIGAAQAYILKVDSNTTTP